MLKHLFPPLYWLFVKLPVGFVMMVVGLIMFFFKKTRDKGLKVLEKGVMFMCPFIKF